MFNHVLLQLRFAAELFAAHRAHKIHLSQMLALHMSRPVTRRAELLLAQMTTVPRTLLIVHAT